MDDYDSLLCRSWSNIQMGGGRAASMITAQGMTEWATSPPA